MIVEQIQILCEGKKISIAQLERILNFGNGSIRRWDKNLPSIDKVLKVANHFNVSVDDLLNTKGGQN